MFVHCLTLNPLTPSFRVGVLQEPALQGVLQDSLNVYISQLSDTILPQKTLAIDIYNNTDCFRQTQFALQTSNVLILSDTQPCASVLMERQQRSWCSASRRLSLSYGVYMKPSVLDEAQAIDAFIRHQVWHRVCTIVESHVEAESIFGLLDTSYLVSQCRVTVYEGERVESIANSLSILQGYSVILVITKSIDLTSIAQASSNLGLNSPTYAWISNRRIDNSIGDGWIQLSPLDTTNSDRKSFESAWNALYPSNNPLSLSVLEHVACLQLIIQGYQDLWLQNPSLVFGNLSLQITNRQLVHGHSLDTTGFSLWNQRNDLNVQIGSYNSTSLTVGSIVYAQGSTKKPDSTAIIDNTNVAFTSGFAIFFYICYVPTLITCIVCGLYSVFRPTRARFERIIIVIGLILSCLNCLVTLGYITTLKCILDTVSLHMGYILVNAALIVLLNKMITFYYGILWIHNGSDWSYLLEALCLIGVQVLIMVGSIASSVPVPVQISVGNNIMTSCQAQNGSGYLILLINDAAAGLYAAVLAFRVRQMRDDMNHAKWVGIIVYNQVVILAVTLFCIGSPVVRLNTQQIFVIRNLAVLLIVWLTLGLLFLRDFLVSTARRAPPRHVDETAALLGINVIYQSDSILSFKKKAVLYYNHALGSVILKSVSSKPHADRKETDTRCLVLYLNSIRFEVIRYGHELQLISPNIRRPFITIWCSSNTDCDTVFRWIKPPQE